MEKQIVKGGCGHSAQEVEKSSMIVGICLLGASLVGFVALMLG